MNEILEGGLWILIPEHNTFYEGSKLKTHIIDASGKTLCGSVLTLGCGSDEATMKFLSQPDPDNVMCKTCKKIAIKFYNQNKTS